MPSPTKSQPKDTTKTVSDTTRRAKPMVPKTVLKKGTKYKCGGRLKK